MDPRGRLCKSPKAQNVKCQQVHVNDAIRDFEIFVDQTNGPYQHPSLSNRSCFRPRIIRPRTRSHDVEESSSMSVSELRLETGEGEHPWMETWNPSHPHLGNRCYQTVSTVFEMHWRDFRVGGALPSPSHWSNAPRFYLSEKPKAKRRDNPENPRESLDVRPSLRGIVYWRDVVRGRVNLEPQSSSLTEVNGI